MAKRTFRLNNQVMLHCRAWVAYLGGAPSTQLNDNFLKKHQNFRNMPKYQPHYEAEMAHSVLQQIKAFNRIRNGVRTALIAQQQSLFLDQENECRGYGLLAISVAPEISIMG